MNIIIILSAVFYILAQPCAFVNSFLFFHKQFKQKPSAEKLFKKAFDFTAEQMVKYTYKNPSLPKGVNHEKNTISLYMSDHPFYA